MPLELTHKQLRGPWPLQQRGQPQTRGYTAGRAAHLGVHALSGTPFQFQDTPQFTFPLLVLCSQETRVTNSPTRATGMGQTAKNLTKPRVPRSGVPSFPIPQVPRSPVLGHPVISRSTGNLRTWGTRILGQWQRSQIPALSTRGFISTSCTPAASETTGRCFLNYRRARHKTSSGPRPMGPSESLCLAQDSAP